MSSPVDKYLAHLDDLSGGADPRFFPIDPIAPGEPRITAITYANQPEPGLQIAFTYGLSLRRQDAWVNGRPELSVCVQSDDPAWALSIAYMATELGSDCPFSYGNSINFGRPIAKDSGLDGYVVFAPAALPAGYEKVDVGDDLPIFIAGMYPTYQSERDFIDDHGLEAFWKLDWDPYDVTRPPAV